MDVVRSIWPRAFVLSWFMDRLGPMIILDHIDCHIRLQSSRLFAFLVARKGRYQYGGQVITLGGGGEVSGQSGDHTYMVYVCIYIIKYRKSEQVFVCA